MLRLGAQSLGVFAQSPCPLDLAHMMPLGEHNVASDAKRDECAEREVQPRFAARVATLAEELPLQLAVVRFPNVEKDVPVRLG